MKEMGGDPLLAMSLSLAAGAVCGAINGWLTTRFNLPSFVATLGMFYFARGLAAWIVSGRQLSGFPERFNLIGRNLYEVLSYFGMPPQDGLWLEVTDRSTCAGALAGSGAVSTRPVTGSDRDGARRAAGGGSFRSAVAPLRISTPLEGPSVTNCTACAAKVFASLRKVDSRASVAPVSSALMVPSETPEISASSRRDQPSSPRAARICWADSTLSICSRLLSKLASVLIVPAGPGSPAVEGRSVL